jgi:hypothetical protein
MKLLRPDQLRLYVVSLNHPDRLPHDVLASLQATGGREARITGRGTLASAELAVSTPDATRIVELQGPTRVVALSGRLDAVRGTLTIDATCIQQNSFGTQVLHGALNRAEILDLELELFVLDSDPKLEHREPPKPIEANASSNSMGAEKAAVAADAAPQPIRPPRTSPGDENDVFPEVGDHVTHFHFGDCIVMTSDGDRIRLRQGAEGRLREVALSMLDVELLPDDGTGPRRFRLTRRQGRT